VCVRHTHNRIIPVYGDSFHKKMALKPSVVLNIIACYPTQQTFYVGRYEGDLLAGEIVRNVCVNLGIDPDTVDGVTQNVKVNVVSVQTDSSLLEWRYNPNKRTDVQLQKLQAVLTHSDNTFSEFSDCMTYFKTLCFADYAPSAIRCHIWDVCVMIEDTPC
jgi:hypothetical protein